MTQDTKTRWEFIPAKPTSNSCILSNLAVLVPASFDMVYCQKRNTTYAAASTSRLTTTTVVDQCKHPVSSTQQSCFIHHFDVLGLGCWVPVSRSGVFWSTVIGRPTG